MRNAALQLLPFLAAGAVGLFAAAPAVTATPALPALSALEAGRWQIRDLDTGAVRSICLGDRRVLMQLRHGGAQCAWTVVRSETKEATVTFDCGNGSGRTALRVETPRLAQVDTQGIIDGLPYAVRAEARHAGSCR